MTSNQAEKPCVSEEYDKLAEQFRKETGIYAPGKSIPVACGGPNNSMEYRAGAFIVWNRLRTPDPVVAELVEYNYNIPHYVTNVIVDAVPAGILRSVLLNANREWMKEHAEILARLPEGMKK